VGKLPVTLQPRLGNRWVFSQRRLQHSPLLFKGGPMLNKMEKNWIQDTLPKINIFIWSLAHGKILTSENMMKRGFHDTALSTALFAKTIKTLFNTSSGIAPSRQQFGMLPTEN
jgi:hypothetical protein